MKISQGVNDYIAPNVFIANAASGRVEFFDGRCRPISSAIQSAMGKHGYTPVKISARQFNELREGTTLPYPSGLGRPQAGLDHAGGQGRDQEAVLTPRPASRPHAGASTPRVALDRMAGVAAAPPRPGGRGPAAEPRRRPPSPADGQGFRSRDPCHPASRPADLIEAAGSTERCREASEASSRSW